MTVMVKSMKVIVNEVEVDDRDEAEEGVIIVVMGT